MTTTKPHGNTGRRNAAKDVIKSERVVFMIEPEIMEKLHAMSVSTGQSPHQYARDVILRHIRQTK